MCSVFCFSHKIVVIAYYFLFFSDSTQRYEGCKCTYYEKWSTKIGRFWFGKGI